MTKSTPHAQKQQMIQGLCLRRWLQALDDAFSCIICQISLELWIPAQHCSEPVASVACLSLHGGIAVLCGMLRMLHQGCRACSQLNSLARSDRLQPAARMRTDRHAKA